MKLLGWISSLLFPKPSDPVVLSILELDVSPGSWRLYTPRFDREDDVFLSALHDTVFVQGSRIALAPDRVYFNSFLETPEFGCAPMTEIAVSRGDRRALKRLYRRVLSELRRFAREQFLSEQRKLREQFLETRK